MLVNVLFCVQMQGIMYSRTGAGVAGPSGQIKQLIDLTTKRYGVATQ